VQLNIAEGSGAAHDTVPVSPTQLCRFSGLMSANQSDLTALSVLTDPAHTTYAPGNPMFI